MRISVNVIFVIIGFTLGEILGVGTIISTFLIGPCIQYLLPTIEKRVAGIMIA